MSALDAAGVVITIDADDPALFGTTLCDEYLEVARTLGSDAIYRFAANGIEAAFAASELKERLRAELAASRNSGDPVEV
jgi:aminodeoxyfutalosine deaminase